jgi:shikimate dehydrogenase
MSSHRVITGKTGVLGIIGYPVTHSLSPAMHNAEFERLGLDFVYVPMSVSPESLETCVRGFAASGMIGFNVTIPHKQAVIALLDSVSDEARAVGAVNTVRIREGRMEGFNTDIAGWVDDIQEDILLDKAAVAIVGAGGAARAVAVGSLAAGARSLDIFARKPESAQSLGKVLQEKFPDSHIAWHGLTDDNSAAVFEACDITVNCSPVGMASSPGLPFPPEWLGPHQYVYDTIYTPAQTALLSEANMRGCATRGGLGMLARQGAAAFEIWTGIRPDVGRMKGTLIGLLEP